MAFAVSEKDERPSMRWTEPAERRRARRSAAASASGLIASLTEQVERLKATVQQLKFVRADEEVHGRLLAVVPIIVDPDAVDLGRINVFSEKSTAFSFVLGVQTAAKQSVQDP